MTYSRHRPFVKLPLRWLMPVTLVIAGAASPAQALSPADTKAVQARYRQERSHCLDGSSDQDRATCLREAVAARDEAQKNGLGDSAAPYTENKSKRCAALPGDDRTDCLARMQGQGSVSGSVAAGGLLRELVTREPAAASPVAPAAAPVAPPPSR